MEQRTIDATGRTGGDRGISHGGGLASKTARLVAGHFNPFIKSGRLAVTYPDGRTQVLGNSDSALRGEVTLNDWRVVRRVVSNGALGFAEAYMAGEVDSPNLRALFDVVLADWDIDKNHMRRNIFAAIGDKIQHALRANSKSGSRANIAAHYDLGNDFYAKWLDDSMTYSSALFADLDPQNPQEMGLSAGQDAKYQSILDLGGMHPGSAVLEIGCGWGGFAEYAAKAGCTVTGITISQEQYNFAAERIQRAGLNEKVELRLQDYRDVEPAGFDRVASIEMFEAVGEKYWPTYFAKVREVLKEGGRAALQIITIDEASFEDYRRNPDFIQKYIFPGGMLPSPTALRQVIAASGLRWQGDIGFAKSYAETLMRWNDRFQTAWPEIKGPEIKGPEIKHMAAANKVRFDDRFKRMWEYYLQYCAAGFDAGRIDVKQVALAR